MGEKQRVGVVFGGSSVEHEVSVVSARGVRRGLEAGPFDCVPIGVTEEGRWLAPELSEPILSGEQPRVEIRSGGPPAAELQIDPGRGCLVRVDAAGERRSLGIDAIFPLIHGWGGEDGRIQGLLELAGIPYVGSGVLGSAVGMDKEISKSLFEYHGLPVGPWTSFRQDEYRRDPEGTLARVGETLGFPVFVKPANGGSSVGVSRVDGPDALPGAVDTALGCDPKGVVEADLRAREIECAVIGNDDPEASVPGEILPSREFYDYASKYEDGTSVLVIPAEVPEDVEAEIRAVAVRAFRVLDLAGLARVDFFLQRDGGRVYLNEVNTLPGFTPISMFPKLWEASGVSYPRLLERLVSLALERWNEQRGRATRRGT
jgi:D-alanine-D-alanine ligase